MTVATNASTQRFTGSGTTGPFSFNFRFFDNSQIVVTKTVIATGAATVLTLGIGAAQYSLIGAKSYQGGQVTLNTALTNEYYLTISRVLPVIQSTDLRNQGPFYAETVEDQFDYLTMVAQQQQNQLDRSLKFPVSASLNLVPELPIPQDGFVIAWDGTTGKMKNAASVTNIDIIAGISGAVSTVSGIASQVTAVAANATNINTVAGSIANVNAVGPIASSVTIVASMPTAVTTVAGIASSVVTVAGIASAVSTVAANMSSVNTIVSNLTAVQNASANATTASNAAAAASTSASNAATSEANALAYSARLQGTSSTSNTVGLGAKSFATQANKLFSAGTQLIAYSAADPTKQIAGPSSSYSGTALTIDSQKTTGSGAVTDWVIQVSGMIGATGPAGSLDFSVLPAEASPAIDDYMAMFDTSEGAVNKMRFDDYLKVINGLTSDTSPDGANDAFITYDASAGTVKKISVNRVFSTISSMTSASAITAATDVLAIQQSTNNRKITYQALIDGVSTLTAKTAPALNDLFAIYDTTGAAAKNMTFNNYLNVVNLLTEDTTPDKANDFVLTYDASASAVKKVRPNNLASGGRTQLTGNKTYYVATTGNDSNDGLTVGTPWLTIQKAINYVMNNVDMGGAFVTIKLADGTYTNTLGSGYPVASVDGPWTGQLGFNSGGGTNLSVVLQGNTTTPGNVILSATSAAAIQIQNGANIEIQGLKVQTTTSGSGIDVGYHSSVYVGLVTFGACAGSHLKVANHSIARIGDSYQYNITGNAGGGGHWDVQNNSTLLYQGNTVNISGSPSLGVFASCVNQSLIFANNSIPGTVTSTIRYFSAQNSIITTLTQNSPASYFPGTSAGVSQTGGLYF